mgnify:CR=1 FL=1
MAKFISIANQKGGVGKTTTAMNLGVALKQSGKRVLLIDFDTQANLSEYLGFKNDNEITTISDLMMSEINYQETNVEESIQYSEVNDIDYIPSDLNLATVENYLSGTFSKETVLKRIIGDNEIINAYDYVFIDCPPTLAILLINALTLCDGVIIPVQAQMFAYEAIDKLYEILKKVKMVLNPNIKVVGILPTMVNTTKVSKEVIQLLNNNYSQDLFNTVIPASTEASKSARNKRSLCLDTSKLGNAYKELAKELINKE